MSFRPRALTVALATATLSTLCAATPARAAATVYYAGWSISRPVSETRLEVCSTAFKVRDSAGNDAALTAGHCGATGTWWRTERAGEDVFGYTSVRRFARDATADDWALVREHGPYALKARVWDAGAPKIVTGLGRPSVGMAVCSTGRTSGTRCGKVLDISANGVILTSIKAAHGDSGAPLFRRVSSTEVKALGLLSYSDSLGRTGFQSVREALARTGATLATA